MKKFLNKMISGLKNEEYQIDDRIPSGYLLRLSWKRTKMLLKGKLSGIKNRGMLFIGKHVTIKVKSKIQFGKGITINDGSYIDAMSTNGILFGNHVSVGRNTKIECTGNLQHLGKGLKVGDHTGLGTDCFYGCAGGIEIGSDTIVGNYVSFHAETHGFHEGNKLIRHQGVTHKGITVGNNCWIGAKATILDGAVIEDNCIIAAGAIVVAGLYEANGIYGGIPAKLLRNRNETINL